MATRFYLPSSGDAAVQPPWSAGWEKVKSGAARRCTTAKQNTAITAVTMSAMPGGGTSDLGLMRYVSDSLQAQAIAGTVKGQLLAGEGASDHDFQAQMVINLVSNDGASLRGVLLDFSSAGLVSEFVVSAAGQNRKFPVGWTGAGAALAGVAALAGDRLVIEVGARCFNATGVFRYGGMGLGDSASTDLPEDETTTAALNAWIEFSQNLLFQSAPMSSVAAQAMHHYRRRRAA